MANATVKELQTRIEELEALLEDAHSHALNMSQENEDLRAKLSTFETKLEIKRARQKARRQDPAVKAARKARRLARAKALKESPESESYDEDLEEDDFEELDS